MKKALVFLTGLFLLIATTGIASATNIYSFEDMIDYWSLDGTQYGETQTWAHPFDAVPLTELCGPLTYTHDINDQVNFGAGDYVVDATLQLDFTNDLTDDYGSKKVWIFTTRWDFREYVSYGFDGDEWGEVGAGSEIDAGQYAIIVNIDWLNDDGKLDVTLDVHNPLGTASAWLDHSKLSGNASPIPEPATMLLLGFGLLGIAGVSRKK